MIIVYGIICLSLVVFVHELGHFLAARLCGIEVVRFSIGMGKRLFGVQIGGTDYCVSLFPVGGYCKMKGENALLEAFGKGGEMIKEKGSFYAAHPLKRILVAVSGPFFNVVFAFVAITAISLLGYSVESSPSRILLASEYPDFISGDSGNLPYPADVYGLKSGDTVIAIDGKRVENYSQIQEIVYQNPDKELRFQVDRDGTVIELDIVPFLDRENAIGRIGIYSWSDPVIEEVKKDGPAAAAGLKPGDRIVSMDGKPVRSSLDVEYGFRAFPSNVSLGIDRSGNVIYIPLSLSYSKKGEKKAIETGFSLVARRYAVPGLPFFPALAAGFAETGKKLGLTVKGISLLFRKINLNNAIAGPARMTYLMGSAAESGFNAGLKTGLKTVLDLLSIVSIGLFLTNLLPLPILDGGLIVLFLIETFRKKAFRPATIYKITVIGLVLMAGIFLFTTFNDILFFAKG